MTTGQSTFPRLRITADALVPVGAFADAQATYLTPDAATVRELEAALREHEVGVVAHFYMDAELQGTLMACDYPHIHIADSLAMADSAVAMAKAGVKRIVCLGVDFMSENVRAVLASAGYAHIPVYRAAEAAIGCTLAESAETPAYDEYLRRAGATPRSLHVIYINTSLRVKARAEQRVPTITCTSSNVVSTVLTAGAQIPDVEVWFGPDTYMGRNLAHLLEALAGGSDAAIRGLHKDHDRASIARLRARFHVFEHGTCIVHHMFGKDVAERIRRDHADAFVTAHFEVPGEMFALGLAAQAEGRGVVGSTSNILGFIEDKVRHAVAHGTRGTLPFVLGTESGMITSIVCSVQKLLRDARAVGLDVEIIFPVAGEAIAATGEASLPIVPGAAAGEGCSLEGGCATCPYMKMNHLDALLDVVRRTGTAQEAGLASFAPRTYDELLDGRGVAELGSVPILRMRAFQAARALPQSLVNDVLSRSPQPAPAG